MNISAAQSTPLAEQSSHRYQRFSSLEPELKTQDTTIGCETRHHRCRKKTSRNVTQRRLGRFGPLLGLLVWLFTGTESLAGSDKDINILYTHFGCSNYLATSQEIRGETQFCYFGRIYGEENPDSYFFYYKTHGSSPKLRYGFTLETMTNYPISEVHEVTIDSATVIQVETSLGKFQLCESGTIRSYVEFNLSNQTSSSVQ